MHYNKPHYSITSKRCGGTASPSASIPSKGKSANRQVSCLFKTSGGYFNIQLSTIAYFYAERRFIYAKVGKERLPIKLSIQDLAATMPGYFIRIHRSYIVNVNHIKQIRTKEKEVLVGDTQLPIGYKYKQGLFRKIHLLK